MNTSVRLHRTVEKDDKKKYILVKEGVYFGLSLQQVLEIKQIAESILNEHNKDGNSTC